MAVSRRTRRTTATLVATAATGCAAAILIAGNAGASGRAAGSAQHRSQSVDAASPNTAVTHTPSASPTAAGASAARPTPRVSSSSPKPAATTPPSRSVQLVATQLPAAQAENWQAVGTPTTRTITGHDIGENECADVDGATTWTQQGYLGSGGQEPAIQDTFSFASAAAAQSAYTEFVSAMADCQATTRSLQHANHLPPDALVRQTAAAPHGLAWERVWTGVLGMSAEGPQTNHTYLAVSDTRLVVLQFTEFPGSALYAVSGDSHVLDQLGIELAD